jgi:hypothetical protein
VHNTDNLNAFGNNAVKDEIRWLDENPGFPVEPRPEWAGFGKLLKDFKSSPQSLVNPVCGSRIDFSKFEPKLNEIATGAISVTDFSQA